MSKKEVEENEMTTITVSSELLITEGNVELSTTGGIGEVSITTENEEVPILKTEGNDDSGTDEYSGVSVTKGFGKASVNVLISEADAEESTTKVNGEDSSSTAVIPVTVLIVCSCVAVLLGVCLFTSFYYWRKLRTADCSENVQSGNFQGRSSENNESDVASAESLNVLSWQPDSLMQVETSISAEMELLQRGTRETATEGTRV
jgi:hypothetical protein